MVGKLLKHDLVALFRLLLYFSCFALGFAILSRILMTANDTLAYVFMLFSLYASIALIFVAFIGSLSRFYKSLFTGEGYMTFSLPVSVSKLLISKLLSAIIVTLAGFVVFFICLFILLTGLPADTFVEVMHALGSLFDEIGALLAYDPLITVELVIMLLVAIPNSLLQFFFCLSLGQLFSKHRKGWTFAMVVLSIVVLNILNAYCLMPILNVLSEVNGHLALWGEIIVLAGLDVGYFFLIRYLLSHKLNLVV
ncbi:MAG: hypothetical protein K2N84_02620 [Clostridia bacterium]|nr:hypothetical protein [Clostridia bacterium]